MTRKVMKKMAAVPKSLIRARQPRHTAVRTMKRPRFRLRKSRSRVAEPAKM